MSISTATDDRLLEHVRLAVLQPGEKIRWSGGPDPRMAFRHGLPVTVTFAIMLAVGGGIMLPIALELGLVVWLVLVPYVATCLGFCAIPVIARAVANRTRYVVTDQQVIVFLDLFGKRVTTHYAGDFGDVSLVDARGSLGSISLLDSTGKAPGERRGSFLSAFGKTIWNIDKPEDVRELIMSLKSSETGTRA